MKQVVEEIANLVVSEDKDVRYNKTMIFEKIDENSDITLDRSECLSLVKELIWQFDFNEGELEQGNEVCPDN